MTLIIGVPLAWYLGRYEWKRIRIIRALLSVPFVMPAIVAAMGFIALIGDNSPLHLIGIDLRGQTISLLNGKTISMSELTGFENPGHFIALILAHAWFNISLIIRFVEPLFLLWIQSGKSRLVTSLWKYVSKTVRNLWIPFIGPAIACSSALCFIFSFTSFALVK